MIPHLHQIMQFYSQVRESFCSSLKYCLMCIAVQYSLFRFLLLVFQSVNESNNTFKRLIVI
jgi:hypothetical protein